MQPDPLLNKRPRRLLPRRWGIKIGIPLLVVIVVAGLAAQYLRPVPAVAATPTGAAERRVAGDAPALPWPDKGAAAVAVQGVGTLATFGGDTPGPIASITKVMTAYVVLQDHPLMAGEQGAAITITAADEANFKQRQAATESVVALKAGETLSQYQLLQGLLIPSGNNLADTLARFDAGSVDAFVAKMNAGAAKLGMTHTRFADTNGASNQSQSTPGDLVLLDQQAMSLPAFAEIVKQPEFALPGLPGGGARCIGAPPPRCFNVDSVLGQEGIIGVKTGSLPDIGVANFAFAATAQVGSQTITILGAVTGQDSLAKAFDTSKALIKAVRTTIKTERVLTATDQVGYYLAPWGDKASVLAPKDVEMLSWPGMTVKTTVDIHSITAPAAAGSVAGTMTVSLGDQQVKLDLKTAGPISAPGRRWRLTRTP